MRSVNTLLGIGLVAFFVLALAADASAVTYYVRQSGSDSMTGKSAAQAFKTIKKAATLAIAGDTVYVGAGTYVDVADVAADGTSANPIRFVADSSGAQTGDAGAVIVQKKEGFKMDDDDYIEIIGFVFNGEEHMTYWENGLGGVVRDCEFRNGKTPIFIKDARVTIDDCHIHDNEGEGINVEGNSSNITIRYCIAERNQSRGILIKGAAQVVIEDTVTSDNGDHGIRLEADGSIATISRCTMQRNKDGFHSHGQHQISFDNCLMTHNAEEGIQMHANDPSITINHCTIVANVGSGIDWSKGIGTIRNTIVALNGEYGIVSGGGFSSDYDLVYGNVSGKGSWTAGSHDIFVDPKFVGAVNYHLQPSSPAIDVGTGTMSVDLNGTARPNGAGVDRGCYEDGPNTYYVRISGSDSNTGISASKAFRTISKAASMVTEGSIVYVGGGAYSEGVVVEKQGTSSNLIRFIADTSGTKTGDAGAAIVTAPVALQYSWSIQNSAYISLDGFRISGTGMPQANGLSVASSTAVTIKNCEIDRTIYGIYGISSTLTLTNCSVHDTTTAGVWLKSVTSSDLQVTGLTLANNGTYGVYADACTLTFNSTNIANWAISGSQYAIAGLGGTLTLDNITINGGTIARVQMSQGTLNATNTVFPGSGYGLSVDGSNVTLTGCTLSGNTVGLYANQNNSLQVTNSTFTGSTQWGASVTPKTSSGLSVIFDACTFHSNAAGLALVNAVNGQVSLRSGTLIRDNTSSGLHFENCNLTVNDQAGGTAWRTLRNGNGISSNGSTLTLSNVSIEQSGLYGVRCENSSVSLANCTVTGVGGVYADAANDNLTVASARFDASSAGGWGVARYGGNLDIKNCVLNGFDGGVYLSAASGADRAVVNNSTLVNLAAKGVYLASGDATVQNTVLVGSSAASGLMRVSGQLTHSHNLLHGFGTPFSGTTADASELLKNPRFVDAASGDFRLAKGSPGINSGADLTASGLTVDMLGNARPSHKVFEMGAYEYMQSGGSLRVLSWKESR